MTDEQKLNHADLRPFERRVRGGTMTEEVTVDMPLHLTNEMMKAVRENEMTRCDDKDEMNTRIGWLICAYDVMVEKRCASYNE